MTRPQRVRVSLEVTREEAEALLRNPYLDTLWWGYEGEEREHVRRGSEALVMALREARYRARKGGGDE
jgi:hypothetical protein